jgi:hypothetical protein
MQKEIDQRVAQEIKNHKEAVYGINLAVQEINRALFVFGKRQEEHKAYVDCKCKQLEIKFDNQEMGITQEQRSCFRILDGYQQQINEQNKSIDRIVSYIDLECVDKKQFNHFEAYIGTRLSQLEASLESLQKKLQSEFILIHGRMDSAVAQAKQEMKEHIPSLDPLKDYIQARQKECQTDIEGFRREIEILKRTLRYADKKFENVYTLLDRLKGEK